MKRAAKAERKTKETDIRIELNLDGSGIVKVDTGIPFFDHMLTLFGVHGFFDLSIGAKGDLEVDSHHTIEDVGLVLGDALSQALGDRTGIRRFGHAVIPMDDALTAVTIDLSNRPYLVFRAADPVDSGGPFGLPLAREFFRALANRAGMNLHINVSCGDNEHHIIESVFKATGRALDQATSFDQRLKGVPSTKGSL